MRASYLVHADGERDGMDYTPESSRRARGVPVWAAIRGLGRSGVADLVDCCCALARRFADRLGEHEEVEVLNEVVLNQVLVRLRGDDAGTLELVRRVQADGTCWLGGTSWRGRPAVRISVSNWSTDESDVDAAVGVILRCAELAG